MRVPGEDDPGLQEALPKPAPRLVHVAHDDLDARLRPNKGVDGQLNLQPRLRWGRRVDAAQNVEIHESHVSFAAIFQFNELHVATCRLLVYDGGDLSNSSHGVLAANPRTAQKAASAHPAERGRDRPHRSFGVGTALIDHVPRFLHDDHLHVQVAVEK